MKVVANGNGNGKTVTLLVAICMFLAGVVVTGLGAAIRGDFLGKEQAEQVETRVNQRIDRTLSAIERRLERLEDKVEGR